MSILGLSNQYISRSFNGLMQISSSGQIFDGDGNLVTLLNVSSAYAPNVGTSTLQTEIVSNVTVGGAVSATFSPGTSIETIIRTMLVTYIPPTLSSLSMRMDNTTIPSTTREVGASFTANKAFFTAGVDNPTGIYPLSASFTSSGASIADVRYYFGDSEVAASNDLSIGNTYTYTRITPGAITFTVNGRRSDTRAAITPTTTTIAFQWRNYLGASSTIITDNASAQTVINAAVNSTLASSKAWTATCTAANDTAGNFTYIIYPASHGNLLSIIQDGATPVLGAFTLLGDYTVTNTNGISQSYRVYKSNSSKAFASGIPLAIT